VQVAPGTFACLPHAIRIQGVEYTVQSIPAAAIGTDGDAAGFVRQIVRALCPAIVFHPRNLLSAAQPTSLSAAAESVGLPPPHRIAIAGACIPRRNGSSGHSRNYYATVILYAFDAAGRFVPANATRTMLPDDAGVITIYRKPSFNDAIVPVPRDKYQPDIGTFRWPYYNDSSTIEIDLDALLGQGVSSLAVGMFPERGYGDRLVDFRRKAVRIIEPESRVEIAMTPVLAPFVCQKWSMLAGGLVFVNDGWSWVPADDLVAWENVEDFQARWNERLVQAQCLAPQ
jgi:hypothetical protein